VNAPYRGNLPAAGCLQVDASRRLGGEGEESNSGPPAGAATAALPLKAANVDYKRSKGGGATRLKPKACFGKI
jgi:hypothetical protein